MERQARQASDGLTVRHPQISLGEISRRMRRSFPVFIVGEARSGSTILFRTLLNHPAFKPRVENLQETSFIIQAAAAANFTATEPRNMRRFMLEDEKEWAAFLSSIRPLRGWLRLASLTGKRGAWWLGPSVWVARSYAFHAKRARRVGRLVEKTPNHIYHLDRILRCFPNARLIYIHRHPVDVYSSLVRRGTVDPKADWARVTVEEFCGRYRSHLWRALDGESRHPESLRLLRYEEFTANPEAVLADLCQFLGVPYMPEALASLDDPDGWAHWEKSRHLYEGIKTHTKRWQDYCDRDTALRIQDHLRPEMAYLGYEPYPLSDDLAPVPADV